MFWGIMQRWDWLSVTSAGYYNWQLIHHFVLVLFLQMYPNLLLVSVFACVFLSTIIRRIHVVKLHTFHSVSATCVFTLARNLHVWYEMRRIVASYMFVFGLSLLFCLWCCGWMTDGSNSTCWGTRLHHRAAKVVGKHTSTPTLQKTDKLL
jgi:hypothetical protein